MTISSVSSNNYYSNVDNSEARKSNRGHHNRTPLIHALNSLEKALDSGKTAKAEKVLSRIMSHVPRSSLSSTSGEDTTSGTTNSTPGTQIGDFLKQIQTALSSGDTSTAQTAVDSLQDYLSANPAPPPPGPATEGPSTPANPLETGLTSLEEALGSNDTAGAQQILSDLLAHAPKTDSASDSTATEAGDSAGTSNPAETITNFLNQLKAALDTGDTSTAGSLLSSLKDFLQKNPPPPPPGMGTYSTAGCVTSGTSTGSSAVDALA